MNSALRSEVSEVVSFKRGPERIVCLTEETVEWLYLLGEQERIVGISGFAMRPPEARRDKPKVSLFTDAKIDAIKELKPDLVIAFSDIQANIARDLISEGLNVWCTNQRSVPEILETLLQLASMVGCRSKGIELLETWEVKLGKWRENAAQHAVRPRVYFEEWPDPMMTTIRWVSELIEIVGGDDIFREQSFSSLAKGRIVSNQDILDAQPELYIGSWCGKKVKFQDVKVRHGWHELPCIKDGQLFEINSTIILQPGPAAILDGVDVLGRLVGAWRDQKCA